jgi:hypothetical protein
VAVTVHEALPDVAGGVKCPEQSDEVQSFMSKMARSPPGALVYSMMKSIIRDDAHFLHFCLFAGISLAAGEGFEPSLTDPESVVLPLHHPARQRGVL